MATDDVNEKLSEQTEVTKLLNETLKSMIDLLGEGSDGFGNLSRQINETIKDKSSLIDEEIRAQKEAKKLLEYMEKEIESVESLGSAYNLAQKYIKQLSKEHASLRNAMAAASGAMKGFQVGFNALKAIGGGVFDVLKSVTGAIVDFSMAILSAPFKMLEGLIGLAKQGMGSTELATALENVRKTFGDIDSGLGKNIVDMGRAMTQGMVAPGLRATQVFGFLHEAIEAINKVASAAPEAFQKLSDQFKGEGSRNILGMSKGLGIAEEDLTKLMGVSISTGQSMISMETEMTKYAKGMSRQFGMDSKLISRDMAKAMTNVKYFANSTIKEISEAVVYTQKLGLSLEKVTGIMDAFSTFDKAAENVSRLSQAFGVNIDTMKLMKAKNPAEQIDLLKKSFQEAGKSVESMDRFELQLLASTLNLDEATVKQMLSSKNQGESLDKVKSASGKLQHQTMSTAEAMQSLSKDIDRLVKAGQVPESNSLWGMFGEGFLQGISRTKEFQLLIQNLRKDMWIVTQAGRELGVAFLESFPGFKEIISGLTKVFDPEGIKKLFKSFNGAFTDFFKDLSSGTATVEGLMDKLQKIFTDYAKGAAGEEFLGGLSKFWEAAKRIIATGIDWVSNKLRDGLNFMVDLLKDDGKQSAMVSAAEEQLSPILTALKGAWNKIKGPLKELFTELLSKIGDLLWELFKDNWGKIALIQLTPVFVGALGNMFMKAAERRLLEGTLKPILSQMAGNIAQIASGTLTEGLAGAAVTGGGAAGPSVAAAGAGIAAIPLAWLAAGAAAIAAAVLVYKAYRDRQISEAQQAEFQLQSDEYRDLIDDANVDVSKKISAASKRKVEMLKQAEEEEGWGVANFIFGGVGDKEKMFRDAAKESDNDIKKYKQENDKKRLSLIRGTAEYEERMLKERKATMEKNREEALKMIGPITVENAEQVFDKLQKTATKIKEKAALAESTLREIHEKFKGQDFSLFTPEQSTALQNTELDIRNLTSVFKNISDSFDLINGMKGKADATFGKLDTTVAEGSTPGQQRAKRLLNVLPVEEINTMMLELTKGSLAGFNVETMRTAADRMEAGKKVIQQVSDLMGEVTKFGVTQEKNVNALKSKGFLSVMDPTAGFSEETKGDQVKEGKERSKYVLSDIKTLVQTYENTFAEVAKIPRNEAADKQITDLLKNYTSGFKAIYKGLEEGIKISKLVDQLGVNQLDKLETNVKSAASRLTAIYSEPSLRPKAGDIDVGLVQSSWADLATMLSWFTKPGGITNEGVVGGNGSAATPFESITERLKKINEISAPLIEQASLVEKTFKGLSNAFLAANAESISQGAAKLTDGMSELNKGLDELLATPLTKDVTVKFGKVANAIGIKNAQYQLAQMKNMTIMLNMNVTLDAASLENELVVKRRSGIIHVALDKLGEENDLRMDDSGKMGESPSVGTK